MEYSDLDHVNFQINNKVRYISDSVHFHTAERWEDATEQQNLGDCEDFSLAKLHALLELGWPIEALRLTFCWVGREADDTGHAVLVVEYKDRLYVLDNRYMQVRELDECTDYVWNTTQEIGGSQHWVSCKSVFSKFYDTDKDPE